MLVLRKNLALELPGPSPQINHGRCRCQNLALELPGQPSSRKHTSAEIAKYPVIAKYTAETPLACPYMPSGSKHRLQSRLFRRAEEGCRHQGPHHDEVLLL